MNNSNISKTRHVPTRMCIACRTMRTKDQLIRIVLVDGQPCIDNTYKAQCRGMYICKCATCINKLIKYKNAKKKLGFDITSDFVGKLEEEIAK